MVETERLRIFPLTADQINLYLQADNRFEQAMNLVDCGRTISPAIREMVEGFTLPKIRAMKAEDYLFITFWLVVNKLERKIVAELGFKGCPDAKGQIEIGYGTMPGQRSRGYMTEAVKGMIGWAKLHPAVKFVLAETDISNLSSQRVLQKNRFVVFDRKENMLWWKVNVE